MIELTFSKHYGDRTVLNLSLNLEEGKRYALVGANGSGKSTLLKILGGLTAPDKGSTLCGLPVKAGVCYMPQNSYAFSMSLKSNVFAACPDLPRFDSKTRIYYNDRCFRLIDEMGLWKLRHKNAAKLSGGETQRMALCRVLVVKHELLLLDEPTSAMDISAAGVAEGVLGGYYEEFKPTVIFATHSVKQAERMADEVIFLHEGKVAERGVPAEILSDPKTEELKNFLAFNL